MSPAAVPALMSWGHLVPPAETGWEINVVPLSSADARIMTAGVARPTMSGVTRRPRPPFTGYRRDRPLWGVEALTPAEARVARLAADGLSNPQIAAMTSVTRGTIECQLQAVYRKLGIVRRQDLPELLDPAIAV
jgi:DNA-binding NarL/FixJ family response regulator